MRDLKLDETGDIVVDDVNGDVSETNDHDEKVQNVNSMLNTFLEEMSWNADVGLNQMQLINELEDKQAVEATLNDYLEEHLNNYESITVTKSEVEDRTLNITAQVKLSDGTTIDTAIGGDSDAS